MGGATAGRRAGGFGDELRRLRRAAGLTQEELAERAGLSTRGISDLERGARTVPRRDTLLLLADGLGLTGDHRVAFLAAVSRPPSGPTARPGSAGALVPFPEALLPVHLDALVGRNAEVAAARSLLTDPAVRLLTLTGPGGVGKTRLAIAAARDLLPRFSDRVAFVPLAAVTDPALVPAVVAAALGAREAGVQRPEDAVAGVLRLDRVLVILDNLEQVIDAAPFVARLLASCPGLSVLATSREPLRLAGEHRFPLPPLGLPAPGASAEATAAADAVRLFDARARAVDPAFALGEGNAQAIAEVVRRLDGLPLAIELAAARITVLPPQALLDRLDRALPLLEKGPQGAPGRHRTLRAAIAWSHELLTPAERVLFRRLSVFVGGFSLETVEEFHRTAGDDADRLDTLSALVEKSLVKRQDGSADLRYAMLETLREFALDRLRESGEETATRTAHAAFFLALAEAAEPALTGPDQATWFARLEDDHANLRSALAWFALEGDADGARRLASALWWFWLVRGHLTEGRVRLEEALSLPGGNVAMRAKALVAAGHVAAWQGEYAQADAWVGEALAIRRGLPDQRAVALSLCAAVNAAVNLEEYDRAEGLAAEAAGIAGNIGDARIEIDARNLLGVAAAGRGDYGSARVAFASALRASDELADVALSARIRGNAALAALLMGDLPAAEAGFRAGLAMDVELGSARGIGFCLRGFAGLAAASGDDERAARLFGATEAIYERIGEAARPVIVQAVAPIVEGVRVRLGPAAFAAAWASGRALSSDEAAAEALQDVPARTASGPFLAIAT